MPDQPEGPVGAPSAPNPYRRLTGSERRLGTAPAKPDGEPEAES